MKNPTMKNSTMKKQLYVFDKQNKPSLITIRNYSEPDFDQLIEIQKEAFPPPFPSDLWWNKEQLANHVRLFPEGAVCVEKDGDLIGSITALLVSYHDDANGHTWSEITDNGYITNHDPDGDSLYIVDICVRPSYRQLGLGKQMMQAMYELVIEQKLTRLLGGGRMSGYRRYAHEMSADTYLAKVVDGELYDPVITFLLRCGRMPIGVLKDYLPDEDSCNYAALMEWKNPFKI